MDINKTISLLLELSEKNPEEKKVGDWTIPPIKMNLESEDIERLKRNLNDYINHYCNAFPERGKNV